MKKELTTNLIDIRSEHQIFRTPGIRFSVSGREIRPDIDIGDYLKVYYPYCEPKQISSVFGNTTLFSRFYGGRVFRKDRGFTECHLQRMKDLGIGLSLTLTNHFFDEAIYNENREFLEQYHTQKNAVICINDQLAMRIRKDFPKYRLKAGMAKNLNTKLKINQALELYNSVTLPMDVNNNEQLLESLEEKERIILFGNAGCAYTCPKRICYHAISKEIRYGEKADAYCSKKEFPRAELGYVFFDIKKYSAMGFHRFKIIPIKSRIAEMAALNLSNRKSDFYNHSIESN